MVKVDILGIKVDKVNLQQALKKVEEFLADSKKHYIVTPNPEMIVLAQKDGPFGKILNKADLAIPDGIGLIWASKVLSSAAISQRVTGIDLMEKICQMAEKKRLTVGLIGGKGETAKKVVEVLQNKYPKLRLRVFKENDRIVSDVDILFVAYGAPKQEKWIVKNLPEIGVKVTMGVGGAFEMIAGIQKRAPKWLREAGFEWFWRLIWQPWRIKRQLALPIFVFLVLKQKFLS